MEGKTGKKITLLRKDFKNRAAFEKTLEQIGVKENLREKIDEVELEIFDGLWAYPDSQKETVVKEKPGEYEGLTVVTVKMTVNRIE